MRTARDSQRVFNAGGAVVAVAIEILVLRISGLDLYAVLSIRNLYRHFTETLLTVSTFHRIDLHRILVPNIDMHVAVDVRNAYLTVWRQRISLIKHFRQLVTLWSLNCNRRIVGGGGRASAHLIRYWCN